MIKDNPSMNKTIISLTAALLFLCSPCMLPAAAASDISAVDASLDMYTKGAQALRQGDNKTAEEMFSRALELNPGNVDALNDLGTLLGQQNRLDEAIQKFQEVLKVKPDDIWALSNIGTAYGVKGDTKKAIEIFEKVITVNPSDEKAYFNLALAYTQSGLTDKAKEMYNRIIALKPGTADAAKAREELEKLSGLGGGDNKVIIIIAVLAGLVGLGFFIDFMISKKRKKAPAPKK